MSIWTVHGINHIIGDAGWRLLKRRDGNLKQFYYLAYHLEELKEDE